jgi:hypothetical protein
MGLFDFVKDIGKKVFSTEEEASDKVKGYLEEENPGVKDLGVSVQEPRSPENATTGPQPGTPQPPPPPGNARTGAHRNFGNVPDARESPGGKRSCPRAGLDGSGGS